METLIFIGVMLGLALGIALTSLYFTSKTKKELHNQSTLLLEKIKQVCKLITVEGEFSEIFTHRGEKNYFFNLFQLEKKALLIIKAKVLIGFDLTKIKIETNPNKKLVLLSQFPTAEILSIDSDLEYYDVQKGIINKFSGTELTKMNKNSKEFIRDKVDESDLYIIANHQALDTIKVIQELIESVGWRLETENLKLEQAQQAKSLD